MGTGVKAQVLKRSPDVADLADVALCHRPFDRSSCLPDGAMGCDALIDAGDHTGCIEARQVRNASEGFEDVSAVATGVAGHQDGPVTLAEGERRGPVGMAGATAHGGRTCPCTFQVFDEPAELWSGSVADQGHDALPDPAPLPCWRFRLIEVLGNHRSTRIRACTSLGIANDKGLPDPQPLRIGSLLRDAGKARAKRVGHRVDAPGPAFLEPDRPELRFAFTIGQAAPGNGNTGSATFAARTGVLATLPTDDLGAVS